MNEDHKVLIASLREAICRAIHTLWALRDPDHRYLAKGSAWLFDIKSEWINYGQRKWPYEPLPKDISRMEIAAVWLAWLRRTQGEDSLRRIIGYALGVPTWKLAWREKCTERTILYRMERSYAAILAEYGDIRVELDPVDEKARGRGRWFIVEKPAGASVGTHSGHPLAYVHGVGQVQNGRVVRRQRQSEWRDGSERAYPGRDAA